MVKFKEKEHNVTVKQVSLKKLKIKMALVYQNIIIEEPTKKSPSWDSQWTAINLEQVTSYRTLIYMFNVHKLQLRSIYRNKQ